MQAPGILGINQLRQQKLTHLSFGIESSSKVIKVNEVKTDYGFLKKWNTRISFKHNLSSEVYKL